MVFLASPPQRELVLRQLATGVFAATWLYYDSFPDAEELDDKTLGHLTDAFLSVGLSVDELETVLQEAEVLLNADTYVTSGGPANSEGQPPPPRTAGAEPQQHPAGEAPAPTTAASTGQRRREQRH
jgi:hypothetical protein